MRRRACRHPSGADGHVRVAASVPVDGARLSGADKGARAPANWSPLAPPVSVWVSLDPVSVPGARRPTGHPRCLRVSLGQRLSMARALPAGGRLPKGSRQLVTLPPARAAPPPRQLGQPTGRRALACAPPSLLLLLLALPRPPRPSSPSLRRPRARDSLLASRARAAGPPAPSTDSLNRDPRAAGVPLSIHIPTDLARPIIVKQTFPGPNVVPGRPHLRGRPHAAPC
ncbi:hypothetical protein V6Z77_010214 [Aspergillus fumigatus]